MPATKTRPKKTKPKKLSWKARRKGKIYCAPACGADCTWAAYKLAKRRANALAKRMGKGWTIRVHENMGWHYNVVSPCGRIKLHEDWRRADEEADIIDQLAELVPDYYSAYLGDPDSSGGRWAEHGDTAEEAIRNVVAAGQADLARISAVIGGLERWSE